MKAMLLNIHVKINLYYMYTFLYICSVLSFVIFVLYFNYLYIEESLNMDSFVWEDKGALKI